MPDNFIFSFTIFFSSQRKHFLFVNHLDPRWGCLALTFVFDFLWCLFCCFIYFRISCMSLYLHHLYPSFVPCSSSDIPLLPLKSWLPPLYLLLLHFYNTLSANVACFHTCLGLTTWDWITCQGVYTWRKLSLFLSSLQFSVAFHQQVWSCEVSPVHVGRSRGVVIM